MSDEETVSVSRTKLQKILRCLEEIESVLKGEKSEP